MLKKILIALVAGITIIQFFKPEKNISTIPQKNTLINSYTVPSDVKIILKKACVDCHSNNTNYPWYSQVQPIAWWLSYHINNGKKHFNLDEFLSYNPKKQDHKMEELIEMVKNLEMPLNSYTWAHSDARLTNEERYALTDWATAIRKEINLKTGFVATHE
ncbi:MAG: cytochrome C [Chitinophagaceae bacterium]|nr:MAG: cytochrome C [Chitinophagaceae bacterium]